MARRNTDPDQLTRAELTALVRVRDSLTGHEYSTSRAVALTDGDRYEILDSPATNRAGLPLPPTATTSTTPAEPVGGEGA